LVSANDFIEGLEGLNKKGDPMVALLKIALWLKYFDQTIPIFPNGNHYHPY
jgi:hypothetical protein